MFRAGARLGIVLALAWAGPARLPAQTEGQEIGRLLAAGRHPWSAWPDFAEERGALAAMYAARGGRTLWLADAVPTRAAEGRSARLVPRETRARSRRLRCADLASVARQLRASPARRRSGAGSTCC
jgi:hypothetical protein